MIDTNEPDDVAMVLKMAGKRNSEKNHPNPSSAPPKEPMQSDRSSRLKKLPQSNSMKHIITNVKLSQDTTPQPTNILVAPKPLEHQSSLVSSNGPPSHRHHLKKDSIHTKSSNLPPAGQGKYHPVKVAHTRKPIVDARPR